MTKADDYARIKGTLADLDDKVKRAQKKRGLGGVQFSLENYGRVDWHKHDGLDTFVATWVADNLEGLIAEYREDLVQRCKRAHIDAANEARRIIAENPPT